MNYSVKIHNEDHWYTDSLKEALWVQSCLIPQMRTPNSVTITRRVNR